MKIILNFFVCILFASTAVSLQGFTVENRSPYEIRIVTTYLGTETKIPIKGVFVSWIYRSEKFIPPVGDFWKIIVQSGQKVEVLLGDHNEYCDILVCYDRINYNTGWVDYNGGETYHNVLAHDEIVFTIGKPILRQKNDNDNSKLGF